MAYPMAERHGTSQHSLGEEDFVGPESSESVHIDERAALAALDGQKDLLCELASMFCEDSPQLLTELQAAVAEGDTAKVRRSTHSLKGLAATFYAQPTVDIAQRLELEAAEGRLQSFIDGGVDSLGRSIESLIGQLKARGLTR